MFLLQHHVHVCPLFIYREQTCGIEFEPNGSMAGEACTDIEVNVKKVRSVTVGYWVSGREVGEVSMQLKE